MLHEGRTCLNRIKHVLNFYNEHLKVLKGRACENGDTYTCARDFPHK
jgi:hypothetical protein